MALHVCLWASMGFYGFSMSLLFMWGYMGLYGLILVQVRVCVGLGVEVLGCYPKPKTLNPKS